MIILTLIFSFWFVFCWAVALSNFKKVDKIEGWSWWVYFLVSSPAGLTIIILLLIIKLFKHGRRKRQTNG